MRLTPLDSIDTPLLRLRPLTPADAPALFDQMLGDAGTMRDLPVLRQTGVSQTDAFIAEALRGWEDGSLIRYTLECKETGRLTALIELKPALPRVEIGVIISRHGGARRRRAGVLALQELIDWLIEQPGVYRVFACCAVDGAAHSSMERLGFVKEAVLTNHEPRPNRGLVAADSYLFALTRPAPVPPEPASEGVAWLRNTMQWSLEDA
ncbi:GNAT family N-acetyltransferase [Paraburkholderia bryophila]|jgi:RimJ/RimL family protein N-acetyltransferase|uniref:RimJ/RimL family protein N-acetyltransferase n=1 Tax=Paraburkholderia bryophila TaxID=420952 RepID=A0A329D9C9_9BURK|nr:GNAT family protein [Paraburkholderia bryophila]RAS39245.1 RimJ/RimL family protein N-acetyltransferase [Paraburkholderia bryophila]